MPFCYSPLVCSYVFDHNVSISEVGQLNADNTVLFINGSASFLDIRLNYTANANAYNVTVTISTYFDFDYVSYQPTTHFLLHR